MVPHRIFEDDVLEVVGRCGKRLRATPSGPAKFASRLETRDLSLRLLIRGGGVRLPGGFNLRRGQAGRLVGALALEDFRIELAESGVLENAILHAVAGVARLEYRVANHRVLRWRNVARFILVHRLRDAKRR